jgi:predicted peptidase
MSESSKVLLIVIIISACSCSKNNSLPQYENYPLADLPSDTGGIQKPVYLDNNIPFGYFIYTPSGYDNSKAYYPLLVFLHGAGQKGNSLVDPGDLEKVIAHGPPKLISEKNWAPRYPMVVVSPQCHLDYWDPVMVNQFIEYIISHYRINLHRIYLTGLSMGGYGTFYYLEKYSTDGYVAAAVPICGGGDLQYAWRLVNIPLWAFHGDADNTVNVLKSINMINAINELKPSLPAKLTIYPGVDHNSWERTYDGTGMGTESIQYDPFNISIYDWLFEYSKSL